MDDVVADENEVWETDSADSAEEINDLTESLYKAYKDRMDILVKDEDDGEKDVLSKDENYIMKKGVHDIKVPLPSRWVDHSPTKQRERKGDFFWNVKNPEDGPSFAFWEKFY